MKFSQIVLIALLCGVVAFATSFYVASATREHAAHESAFDRVTRTKTLRCGYLIYSPLLIKDPKTGAFSGIVYDLTELLGRKLGLKVEWVQETSWGTAAQDLDSRRFDMVCSGFWVNSLMAGAYGYTKPLFYQPMWPIVRADDTRFDNDLNAINDPKIRIVSLDGDIPLQIGAEQFPRAQTYALQNFSDYNQLFLEIASNKADVTFLEGDFPQRFMNANPGKIKLLLNHGPIRVYANPWAIKRGEIEFADYLNSAIDEIVFSSAVEDAFKKYGVYPEGYYLVNQPFHPYREIKGL